MPHCALRTKDGDGPWLACLHQPTVLDPDGEWLCLAHLEKCWFCECGRFNVAGNGMPCLICQVEEAAL